MMSVRWQSVMLGLLVGALALGGVGCKKKPAAGPGLTDGDITGVGTVGENGGMGADDQANRGAFGGAGQAGMFPAVYFDYDSALLRAGEEAKLVAVLAHLQQNADAHITVEGHCDERGSNEYNLSLGQRRADAVRAALIGQGADAARVEAMSRGEESPAAPGHDESSWSQNRRGEFIVR